MKSKKEVCTTFGELFKGDTFRRTNSGVNWLKLGKKVMTVHSNEHLKGPYNAVIIGPPVRFYFFFSDTKVCRQIPDYEKK